MLQPALGQDLNDSDQDDKDTIEAGTLFLSTQAQPEEPDSLSQAQPEEPDSLSQAQPDSIEMAKYASVDFKRYEDDANEEKIQWKIKPKRIFYGIAVAVPIYLILSQDKDKDASASKVGPPPDWPNN